jgi:hypothetical protein
VNPAAGRGNRAAYRMRYLIIFTVVSLATFALLSAAMLLALPVGFDVQVVGWLAAPSARYWSRRVACC